MATGIQPGNKNIIVPKTVIVQGKTYNTIPKGTTPFVKKSSGHSNISSPAPEIKVGSNVPINPYSPVPVSSTSDVQQFIQSEKAQDALTQKANADKLSGLLGIGTSSKTNLITDPYYKKQESLIVSMKEPSASSFISATKSGGITPADASYGIGKSIQQKGEQMYIEDYTKAYNQNLAPIISSQESFLAGRKEEYQNIINQGGDYGSVVAAYEKDVAYANKNIQTASSEFKFDWGSTSRGKSYEFYAKDIAFKSNIVLGYEKSKQDIFPSFKTGVGVGAITTGIGLGIARAVGATTVKVAGLAVSAPFIAAALIKDFGAAKGTYSTARELGYSPGKSLFYSTATGTNVLMPQLAGVTGALVGGGAVMGGYNFLKTGRVTGINVKEQKLIEDVLNRRTGEVFKTNIVKGKVTDATLKEVAKFDTGTPEQISSINKGSVFRKIETTINTEGLTSSEIAAVNKLNFKSTTLQFLSQSGKSIKGIEFSNLKSGGILGMNTKQTSLIEGLIGKGGKVIGTRTSFIEQPRFIDNLIKVGSQNRLTEFNVEKFTATGKVDTKGLFRLESSKGFSIRTGQINFKNGEITGFNPEKEFLFSRQQVGSRLFNVKLTQENMGKMFIEGQGKGTADVFELGVSKSFKDIRGGGKGGAFNPFEFKPTSVSTIPQEFSTGGGSINQILGQQSLTKSFFIPVSTYFKGGTQSFVSGIQSISTTIGGGVSSMFVPKTTTTTTKTNQQFVQPRMNNVGVNDLTKFTPVTITSPKVDTRTRGRGGQVFSPVFAPVVTPIENNIFVTASNQNFRLNQNQLQGQQLVSSFKTSQIFSNPMGGFAPSIPGFVPPSFGGFFFPPFKPSLGFDGYLGAPFKGKRNFKYTPNIGSVLSGYKAPKMSSSIRFAEFTGFAARPIISGRASKKRKK